MLWQKMYNIMQAIGFLDKANTVKMGGGSYDYVSEAQFVAAVRPQMIKEGLILFPINVEQNTEATTTTADNKTRTNYYTTVKVAYKIVDVETGEFALITSVGSGVDSGDKAIYKAMTGCFRTMMRQTFMIGTGEDPEATDSDGENTLVSPIVAAASVYAEKTGIKFSKDMLKAMADAGYTTGSGYGINEQKTAAAIRVIANKVKSGDTFENALMNIEK